MLVDDERDIGTVFKRGLESRGFSIETFDQPENALSEFTPGASDFIILDIRMPRISGLEHARAMWEKDPIATICFMTAFEIYEDEAKKVFKDLKNYCFLKKPVTLAALVERIEKHALKM